MGRPDDMSFEVIHEVRKNPNKLKKMDFTK